MSSAPQGAFPIRVSSTKRSVARSIAHLTTTARYDAATTRRTTDFLRSGVNLRRQRWHSPPKIRFAPDSPLEGTRFELPVPVRGDLSKRSDQLRHRGGGAPRVRIPYR